jgi:hypothetical protein
MNKVHQARFFEQIAIMFGREPKKPTEITERAQQVHELKRMANKVEVRAAIHESPRETARQHLAQPALGIFAGRQSVFCGVLLL